MYFSLALILIAVLVVGAAYCLFWRKALLINGEEQKSARYGNRVVFWILLGAALLLCVLASCLLPHHIDLDYYNEWGMYLKRNGPASFYADFPSDYPPLFLYFCTALSWFSDISGIQYAIVYRLFFTLVYVASVLVVCKIAKELGGVKGQAIPLVVIVLYCCKTVRMLLAGRMHTEERDQTVVQDQVCSEDALKE